MSSFEDSLKQIRDDLDRLDLELAMNREAIESIEISLRLLSVELDYQNEG